MMRTSPIWRGNVRERKIGSAVSHAARSSRLALLEGGEAAFTRTARKLFNTIAEVARTRKIVRIFLSYV
jgi:hypothetical protein